MANVWQFLSDNWQSLAGGLLFAPFSLFLGYKLGVLRDRKRFESERASKRREEQVRILETLWQKILVVDEKMQNLTAKVYSSTPPLNEFIDEELEEYLQGMDLTASEIEQILAQENRFEFFNDRRATYLHNIANRAFVDLNNYYHDKKVLLGNLSTVRDKLNDFIQTNSEILRIDGVWRRAIDTRASRSDIESAYNAREEKFNEARQLLSEIDDEISKLE